MNAVCQAGEFGCELPWQPEEAQEVVPVKEGVFRAADLKDAKWMVGAMVEFADEAGASG